MMRWRRRIRTALNEMAEEIDFSDELRRVRRADPFVPFVIVMTSGARYKVTNPRVGCHRTHYVLRLAS